MSTIITKDGTEIFYKDWGSGQPIVFHHGWPLSGDDWDTQMLYFLKQGFRVIAHDRRGHGRSSQSAKGHEMNTYAADMAELAANRAQLYRDIASGPFYGFNRPGAKVSQGVIDNWWRQGMAGATNAHYECIKAFSETDFTEDLQTIDVPVLVLHGDDDQIVPIADSALLSIKHLKKGTLKVYPGLPHGMCTTHADVVNPDILAFLKT